MQRPTAADALSAGQLAAFQGVENRGFSAADRGGNGASAPNEFSLF
jgi:hypothetical protein